MLLILRVELNKGNEVEEYQNCSVCGVSKPYEEYHLELRVKNRRAARCKDCGIKYNREYRLDNKDKVRAYSKEIVQPRTIDKYKTDEDFRDKIRAKNRASYARNAEKRKATVRAYAAANKEKIAKDKKVYRSLPENLAKANAKSAIYRADPKNKPILALRSGNYARRKYNAEGTATREQIQARIDYYSGNCWICHNPGKELDHVKPLSKGGSGWPANLRPICRSCNARKSNTWPFATAHLTFA